MKQILSNLALIAISLAIAGGVSELVLRKRFGAPPVWTYPQEAYEPDEQIGWHLVPRQHSFTHDRPVETNSLGLRDREYPRAVPPEVRRLVALGDSQTFGAGLALEDTWPKQLERELRMAGNPSNWEVVNAGIDGTATWQQTLLLQRLSDAIEIHGVVIGFYVNDVPADLSSPQMKPNIPTAQVTNTWSKRIAYELKRSALFVAFWEARHPIRAWLSGQRSSLEEGILTGEPNPLIDASWQHVERSLASIKEFTDERGLSLWLLVMPRRDQVAGVQPGRAYQQRLAAISERLGIRAVDVLPALEASHAEHGSRLFIAWDGHNSAVANSVIARELAGRISATD